MPPRYSYWTILAGGLPTAFRAADRDELIPTFRRIREKHPDATMKWFARGKLWESPEEAKLELERRRLARARPPRGARDSAHGKTAAAARPSGSTRGARSRDWRPGGEHQDPRKPFADAKRARNQSHRAERYARKNRKGPERP